MQRACSVIKAPPTLSPEQVACSEKFLGTVTPSQEVPKFWRSLTRDLDVAAGLADGANPDQRTTRENCGYEGTHSSNTLLLETACLPVRENTHPDPNECAVVVCQ